VSFTSSLPESAGELTQNHPTNTMETTTAQTGKDEILSNACELIDDQSSKISELEQQLKVTLWGLGVAIVWGILF
jgi:hypothetical protein